MDDGGRAELLSAWQDAVQASKLADRLAAVAAAAAADADENAAATEEIAVLAEEAAVAAERAARIAREVATTAAVRAARHQRRHLPDANAAAATARADVEASEAAYRESETPVPEDGDDPA